MSLRRGWSVMGAAALALAGALIAVAVVGRVAGASRQDATVARERAALFAADDDGRILELDDDGATKRVVVPSGATGGMIGELAVSPDRHTLWFARHDPLVGLPCDSTIAAVPAGGGRPRTVAEGFAPSPSPDGRRLAFVRTQGTREDGCSYAAAVVDIATGAARTWPLDASLAPTHGICSVAWGRSGATLVVEVCSELDTMLHTVDPGADAPAAIGVATLLGPRDPSPSWSVPASAGRDDAIITVASCCAGDLWPSMAFETRSLRTGERLDELDGLAPEVAWVVTLDTDATGERLLYVAHVRDGDGGTRLYRWDGSGAPLLLREGVTAAAW